MNVPRIRDVAVTVVAVTALSFGAPGCSVTSTNRVNLPQPPEITVRDVKHPNRAAKINALLRDGYSASMEQSIKDLEAARRMVLKELPGNVRLAEKIGIQVIAAEIYAASTGYADDKHYDIKAQVDARRMLPGGKLVATFVRTVQKWTATGNPSDMMWAMRRIIQNVDGKEKPKA